MYAIEVMKVGTVAPTQRSLFGDLALVAFLLTQAFDGILTYVGVATFGIGIEGNPLIVWLMDAFGHGAGLTLAKVLAVGFGVALHLSQVHKAVAGLAAFYTVVAVGPWIALLFVWN